MTTNKQVQPSAIHCKRPQARWIASAKKNIGSFIARIMLGGNGIPITEIEVIIFPINIFGQLIVTFKLEEISPMLSKSTIKRVQGWH